MARHKISPAGRPLTAFILSFLLATQSYSAPPSTLPTGGTFVAGTGSVSSSANAVNINQLSLHGIINWNDFSIGLGQAVNFHNGSGATLNRVTGGNISAILGSLTASGTVYLINPEGVVIGPKGTVHTAGDFVASSLSVSNDAFLNGGSLSFFGNGNSVIKNLGSIYSKNGSVFLIAKSVENAGSIHAPNGTVGLAAGQQVLLRDSSSDQRVSVRAAGADVTNSGKISAVEAELKASGGNIYALAGNGGGQITATGTTTKNGHVWLVSDGGNTQVSSAISAVNADGKGGSIETSGAHVSTQGGSIKTGQGGSWLLDPVDLTIDSAAATTIQNTLNAGTNVTEQTTSSGASGAGSVASGNGDINVASNIAWSGSASLALSAYRNININAGSTISNSGAGNLVLRADNASTGTGTVNLNGNLNYSQSTGNISLFYNPTGTAATKYTNATSYTSHVTTNNSWAQPSDHSASAQFTPYMLVNNATDLQNISTNLNGTYALGTDIDASSIANFTPIATLTGAFVNASPSHYPSSSFGFQGVFDGQGHTISHLTMNDTTNYFVGLFGFIGNSGVVRNVNLSQEQVTGSLPSMAQNEVGGLTGHNEGYIVNSSASGSISATTSNSAVAGTESTPYAGGLVGNNIGYIYNSYSAGSVTASGQQPSVGGLVGFNNWNSGVAGTIVASYSSASVSSASTDDYGNVGGLVGANSGQITSSYSTGSVTCSGHISECGGLVGSNNWNINTSYATGRVSAVAGSDAGGVTGYNSGSVTSTYWDTQTTGQSTSGAGVSAGDPSGQTGYTTAQLQNGTLPPGFSTTGKWQPAVNGYYPLLYWQPAPGPTTINVTGKVFNANTPVGSGITVTGLANGVSLGTATTNASGLFALSAPSGTTGVLLYLIGPNKANTFSDGGGTGSFTNVNLIYGTIQLFNKTSNTYSGIMTALSAALGGTSNSNLLFTMSGGNMFPTGGTGLRILNTSSSLALDKPINMGTGTLVINSSGSVAQSQAITASALAMDGAGSFTLTNPFNSISTIASSTTGSQSVVTSGALTVGSVGSDTGIASGGSVLLNAVGDLTLSSGSDTSGYSISAAGSGNALTLVTGGNFLNQVASNSNALHVASGGRWLVYSQNPTNDTRSNLSYSFKQYGATYGTTTVAQATGNGFLYSVAPLLTPGLTGSVNKTYNGATAASVGSANLTASGTLDGDTATLTASSASYSGKNAGSGKAVTANGVAVASVSDGTGASVYGYQLASTTASGNIGTINKAALTAAVSANTKVYDGTTAGSGTVGNLNGVISGDSVSLDTSGSTLAFADKNAGTGKTVSEAGTVALTGTDAGNYLLTIQNGTAAITPKSITASVAANSKVYDRTTTATATVNPLTGTVTGDAVTLNTTGAAYSFADKNVGTGKTVNATGITLSGADANNYALTVQNGSADITPKAVMATVTAGNKVYDGATTATGSTGALTGVLSGDTANLTGTGAYAFADKNAGTGKTVTASGLSLTGADAGNYALTIQSGIADITPKAVTATVTAGNKVYDATTNASGVVGNLSGTIMGDAVVLNTAQSHLSFADKNVGTNKSVGETGTVSLTGADAGNYTLTVGGGTANITPAAVTASVIANNKTYDRTTAATGTVDNPNGVMTGDAVTLNTAQSSLAFADKNAGTGKVVSETGTVALTGADAGNYTLSLQNGTATINPAALTATAVVNSKVYDGTTAATGSIGSFSGVLGGDSVSVNGTPSLVFADKNVGNGKAVTASGVTLTGTDAGNYTIAVGNGTANITPATLTASLTATNKTYDGTTAATGTVGNLSGVIGPDQVHANTGSALYSFSDKNVGNGKSVSASGVALSGADATNYTLTLGSGSANISPKAVTTAVTANNKTYDGTTLTVGSLGALSGLVGSDAVTLDTTGATYSFADKDVGTGKSVTAAGASLQGTDAGNYTLSVQNGTASITPKTLTASVTAGNKIYDGTTAATGSTGALSGVVTGDSLALSGTGAYAFADKNAGTGKTVTVTGLGLTGSDAGNYVLGTPTGTANITPKTITASVAANNKVYDANTAATGTVSSLQGSVGGDVVSLDATQSHLAFADKNAGAGKVVSETGTVALTGADAGNYTLSLQNGTASITPQTVTAAVSADSKVYDRTTAATGNVGSLSGVFTGDTVTLNTAGAAYSFADKNAGAGKSVTATGVALNGADAGNYTLNLQNGTADITPKAVTAVVSASNKVYDAATSAIGTVGNLTGVVAGDTVALNTTQSTLAFADKNVGANKSVSETGSVTLSGADAANYTLTAENGTAAITPKTITTAVMANGKVYDRTTQATGHLSALSGVLGSDTVSLNTTGTVYSFTDKNVGTGKSVSTTGASLTGTDAGNYSLSVQNGSADIAPKTVTAAINANNKVYDGNTPATGSMGALTGVLGGDQVNVSGTPSLAFADKNVGTGKTVAAAAVSLAGADAGNYTLNVQNGTANITPKGISVSLSASSKVYDGTTAATAAAGTLNGVVSGDAVALNTAAATYSFADKNAGTGKSVSAGGVTLSGVDAGNYALSLQNGNADIAPKPITASVVASNKVYDGTTVATGQPGPLSGVIAGDAVQLGGAGHYTFSDKNAGTGKVVSATGLSLSGADAGNYTLTVGNGTADITPATLTYVSDPANRAAGYANPALTGSVTGFVASETASSATTGTAVFTSPATPDSAAGTYAINGAGLNANHGNYTFVQAPGNATALNVTPAPAPVTPVPPPTPTPLPVAPTPVPAPIAPTPAPPVTVTITVNDATRLASQPNPAFSATYGGPALPGLDMAALLTQLKFQTNAGSGAPAGTYQISAAPLPGGANYVFRIQPGTLRVIDDSPTTIPAQVAVQPNAAPVVSQSQAVADSATFGPGFSPTATGTAVTPQTLGSFEVNYSVNWSKLLADSLANAKSMASSSFLTPAGEKTNSTTTYSGGARK